ncbi:hypothetical protein KCTC52924_03603 [Arenibacter antarcticus]|uniref:Uncharacterized protein n=1 Tax=Arenibacter antarcticus TaxID=2040469 RepID=A0ABW5VHI4_9FLAO|nr:hypothetical protein [Arenibacter sp. H213]MCM4169823.1 hypothetical protein [Arenibacter sp. H213]
MNSKSKKAVKSLENHHKKLSEIKTVQEGNSWKATLKDMLNQYIGSESSISKRLDELYFTRKETQIHNVGIGHSIVHVYDESKKQDFSNLIENSISFIRENGIYQNPNRKNFLSGFNNGTIISGIVVGTGIIYGAGHFFGNLEKDREIIKMERELNKQKATNSNLENDIKTLRIENEHLKVKDTTKTK